MTRKKSTITSFRSNRFNNFFEAAASLHFHKGDIDACLQLLPQLNKKLESVKEDNRCGEIDCQIIALGLIFYRITGPYWQLLGSEIHYLDFSSHVVKMHAFLLQWAEDPSDAFIQDFEPLFGLRFLPNPEIFRALLDTSQEMMMKVKGILKAVCRGCVETTERQLADFLPEGKYHGVQDPEVRRRLQHSKLTNMVGEQSFGDLDFSLFKRRNASLHHHSTIHMLKRNKSISSFFSLKTAAEQQELLQVSGRKAPALRRKHQEDERDAVARRQIILKETQAKKIQAENKRREKILDIHNKLRPHDGPCVVLADVDRLLTTYTSAKQRLLAVKAELQFQKLVMLQCSPLLKVTGTMPQLVHRLKLFFGADEAAATAPLPQLQRQQRAPKRRQLHLVHCSSDSECDSAEDVPTEDEVDQHAEEEGDEDLAFEQFRFQEQGQLVAVYFLEDFFVGEVTAVNSPQEGVVNFMENATFKVGGQQAFRWPSKKDECPIAADFVFAKDIVLEPSSSSGRAFIVTTPQMLSQKYVAFKATLAAL